MSTASNEHDSRAERETQQPTSIEGTLERVTWSAGDSAFVIAQFRVQNELFPIAGLGEMLSPVAGDRYVLHGSWEEHQKYGRQFHFTSYEQQLPVTEDGIVRFLASGMLRGIGESTARKIVDRFGTETLEILEHDIGRLREVDGIGAKKLLGIQESWEKQRGVQTVMLFLREHDISSTWAVRIYHTYGGDAVNVVRADPYRMVDDIDGIGFTTADTIARRLGLDANDHRRILAGIVWALREAARRDGHCAMPAAEFVHHAASILEVDVFEVTNALGRAKDEQRIIEQDDMLFLPELHHAELSIAASLAQAFGEEWNMLNHLAIDEYLAPVEQRRGVRFNAQQVEAIHKCLGGPLCVLTGGPGTGKTTTLIGILHATRELGWQAAICAPTGRAAKRITEITGSEAKTIHRLLEFDPATGKFQRGEANHLEADILVVDEVSMVDVELMAALLLARPPGCRIVLVGDADQLPSVGPGAVLRDMIECGEIDTVVLRLVFRQAEQSSIISNAHRVRQGFMPVFDSRLVDGGATFFREVGANENIAQLIRDLVVERLPATFSCDPMRDIQVLSPMHNTVAGVTNLNQVLQQSINGGSRVVFHRGDRRFRAGDKVMQVRNNYDKDVYNGDIGFVHGFDEEDDRLAVDFDGRRVLFSPEEIEHLVLAYAITIHKSQGSEYPIVIVPMVMQHRIMLRRTLLYTAMTRARDLMIILGQRAAVSTAAQSPYEKSRFGSLRDQLRQALR